VLENAGAFMGDGGGGGLIEVTEQGRARKRKSDRIFAKRAQWLVDCVGTWIFKGGNAWAT